MKKLTTFLMLCVLSLSVMAQTSVLVLNDTTEYSISPLNNNKAFAIDKPCARLTFSAKHEASKVTTEPKLLGDMTVEQNVNGKWQTVYEGCPGHVTIGERTQTVFGQTISLGKYEESVTYETLSFDLDRHATQIRFKVGAASTNPKQIKNVQVTMASFVEVTPANLNFGEIEVFSEPVTESFYVEHCNVARLSMSSSSADFALNATTVANSGIAVYKTDTFTVTFTPNIRGQHTATIVVTNGTQTDSIHCSAKVTKKNPVLTWNVPETILVGDVVSDPVSSTCNNDFALISCSENVQIVCGEIRALAEGEATIEVLQLGDDDYWNNTIQKFSITVDPKPEIPTEVAPISGTSTAERYVRNGQVYIRTSETEFSIDGKKN